MVGNINSDIDADNQIYNYKWTITANDFHTTLSPNRLRSPKLTATYNDTTFEWQLWLYPNGIKKFSNDIAISLYNFTNRVVTAIVSFGIIDAKGEVIKKKTIGKKTYNTKRVSEANWGFEKFVERSFIDVNENEFFHNGFLTIECEIKIYYTFRTERPKEEKDVEYSDQEDDFDEDATRLQQFDKYENLMSDNTFSDIAFIVEGKILHAHRCILAKSSPVFAVMFKYEMGEKQKHEMMTIEGVKYEAFVEMLRFIYAGKIDIEFNNINVKLIVADLLIAAGKYCVNGLKYTCLKLMSEYLWTHNAVEIIKLADRYQEKWLKLKAMKLIVDHSNEIDKIADFNMLTETPNILCEICHGIANKKILF